MVATHNKFLGASEALHFSRADKHPSLEFRSLGWLCENLLLHDGDKSTDPAGVHDAALVGYRLRKHADYQRVYRESRKQFSPSMSYFYALRTKDSAVELFLRGPRVGLTAGKILGKAVERNRIKRRMRDIVRRRATIVSADVDIVLHPRRSVLTADFAKLESEVARIFNTIQAAIDKTLASELGVGTTTQ
jgi:ribonuclease P protein component